MAEVEIVQEYYNYTKHSVNSTYVFALPDNAIVSKFSRQKNILEFVKIFLRKCLFLRGV